MTINIPLIILYSVMFAIGCTAGWIHAKRRHRREEQEDQERRERERREV